MKRLNLKQYERRSWGDVVTRTIAHPTHPTLIVSFRANQIIRCCGRDLVLAGPGREPWYQTNQGTPNNELRGLPLRCDSRGSTWAPEVHTA